jgi:hypothetical protein
MPTRKDFERPAAIYARFRKRYGESEEWKQAIRDSADFWARINPRFCRKRFYAACRAEPEDV